MTMKRIFSMLLLMLMVFSANVMMAQQMPPIPVDDQVRIGKLDCGLTYYIRHNDYPATIPSTVSTSTSLSAWAPSRRRRASAVWPTSWSTWPSTAASTSTARARVSSTIPARWV